MKYKLFMKKQRSVKKQIPYTTEEKLLHMAAIVASSDDAIVSKTLQGIITSWNKAAEKIFGYSAKEAIGQSITIIIPPERLHEEKMIIEKISQGKPVEHFDTIRVRKDGTPINISVTISPIKNKNGEIIGASKIARDISKQKLLEKQVQESEAKFRQLFDSNIIGMFISDFDGKFLEGNDTLLKITGYTRKDLHAGKIRRQVLTLPEEQYLSNQAIEDLKKKGSSSAYEKSYIRKDGTHIPVLIAVTRIDDSQTAIGFVLDISEQKKAQEELRRNQEQYRLVFEHATDLITVVDPQCNYIFASPSHIPVLGYTPKELIGINAFDLIHPDDIDNAKKEFGKALKGDIGNALYRFKHKTGTWLIIESTGSAIFNEEHQPTMVVITSHDVTQRTELEQRKDEFISIASHELKTPITSIKVFTQLLLRHNQKLKDNKTVTYLGKMELQIDKLTKLIGDLLDISKIQAGKLTFHKETFPMQKLITETIEIMQTTTDRQTIQMKGTVAGNVVGDRDRISQVLINLISNAIKYSPNANKVVVHILEKDGETIIGVQDFGIGIPQEFQDKIFDRFFRVSGESEKTYPGFGIGLYISSEIIKRHNGKLWVESKKGKGSTFYFSLPVK